MERILVSASTKIENFIFKKDHLHEPIQYKRKHWQQVDKHSLSFIGISKLLEAIAIVKKRKR
jgi:hypothetical protein